MRKHAVVASDIHSLKGPADTFVALIKEVTDSGTIVPSFWCPAGDVMATCRGLRITDTPSARYLSEKGVVVIEDGAIYLTEFGWDVYVAMKDLW